MEVFEQLLAQSRSLLVISLLITLACAVLCGLIAARRKLNWKYWAMMGLVFGPFALPFVFLAKPKGPPLAKP